MLNYRVDRQAHKNQHPLTKDEDELELLWESDKVLGKIRSAAELELSTVTESGTHSFGRDIAPVAGRRPVEVPSGTSRSSSMMGASIRFRAAP